MNIYNKMKSRNLLLIFILIAVVTVSGCTSQPQEKCGNSICAENENTNTCPQDCKQTSTCGDKICQTGETTTSCPEDCPIKTKCGDGICDAKEMAKPGICPQDCPVTVSCGDGTCNGAETTATCPQDCPATVTCGDGTCNGAETTATCPQDCPVAQPSCGDGSCNGAETCSTCSQDCGSCSSSGESHFGVHTGILSYSAAIGYINELGSQIWVRDGGPIYNDEFGWKQVKGESQRQTCQSNCDHSRTSCGCNVGDYYYSSPASRTPLPTIGPTRFVGGIYAGRYDDTVPTTRQQLISAYPTGHNDVYLNFVDYYLQSYKDIAKYWQIENEVDFSSFWTGTPQEYANLVVLASQRIKASCPNCKVVLSFSSPGVSTQRFSAIGGICNSFDVIDLHYINGFHPTPFIQSGELNSWKQICPGKEIISTETGVQDSPVSEPHAGGTMQLQAQDLIKYNTLMFAEGYGKIFWYLIDTDYGAGQEFFLHNALVDDVGSAKKPAFYAYKTMINEVDYFTSVTRLATGQYKYTFSNKGPVYVLWCDSGTCNLPSEISGTVTVTDYLGNAQTMTASQIALTSSPVFIEQA